MTSERQAPTIASLRLIYIALMLGIVLFGFVITILPYLAERQPILVDEPVEETTPMGVLVFAAGALTLIPGFLSRFIGRAIARRGMSASPDPLQGYAAGKIVGAALAEGPGLLWCVMALMSHEPLYLAGAAVCLVLILIQLPSEEELEELSAGEERATP